ncbi:PaaI family thioesterase [Hoeflea prorocentri]|uniref:PaaI family thioesterase n=1 Tax=Hoeflea prorocentri TaxID=1922333 RepID=A0A9X3UHA7_9HYPH|nr:PaaI family thioesterase [Hoeflea prorocentri]MCY6380830.1 PaaI family thioesterase [Hoeflea prorocentri]MDA5398630.1 PaaI family thioesterase [Hoeflea prorocentri]
MKVIRDQTGTQRTLGYVVEIDAGAARIYLDIDERHINRGDTLHGGVMATMLDAVAGYAVSLSVDGESLYYTSTVSLTVNYLSRVSEGRVVATAKVTGGGKKIVFVDALLSTDAGIPVASATGTFKLYRENVRD